MPVDNIKRPGAAGTARGMAPKEKSSMQTDRSAAAAPTSLAMEGVQ
jgi:hypothetical protein